MKDLRVLLAAFASATSCRGLPYFGLMDKRGSSVAGGGFRTTDPRIVLQFHNFLTTIASNIRSIFCQYKEHGEPITSTALLHNLSI